MTLVRFGFLVAASIVVYVVKQRNLKADQSPPPLNNTSENGEASFEQQNQRKDEQQPAYADDNLEEKSSLSSNFNHDLNKVCNTLEREVKLEGELLDYNGLKVQESDIVELQRQLKMKTVEIEMLNIKINSLESERKKLQEEIDLGSIVRKELEVARNKIKELETQAGVKLNKQSRKLIRFSSCFKRPTFHSKVASCKDPIVNHCSFVNTMFLLFLMSQ